MLATNRQFGSITDVPASKLSAGAWAVVAVSFAALGIACMVIERLTDGPLVPVRSCIRRNYAKEAFLTYPERLQALAIRIWPGLGVGLGYTVEEREGWVARKLRVQSLDDEEGRTEETPSASATHHEFSISGGGQRDDAAGHLQPEDDELCGAARSADDADSLFRRLELKELGGGRLDGQSSNESLRRAYARQHERDLGDMKALLNVAARNGGEDIKQEFEHAERTRALFGASRSAVVIGSLVGFGYSSDRVAHLNPHPAIPILVTAIGVACLVVAWILIFTVPARRRASKAGFEQLAKNLSAFFLSSAACGRTESRDRPWLLGLRGV